MVRSKSIMINTIIDKKYLILSKISDTGQVYMAQDIQGRQAVAIKLLDIADSSPIEHKEIKELFKRESEALSQLSHENIIRYLDSGLDEEGNWFYIVTEYILGDNLEKHIKDKQMKIDELLSLYLKILKGVAEAHNNNILHRDLKPSNILIEGIDNPKIIDFGLSKILGIRYRSSTQTLKDYMTIQYASPEQVAREDLNVQSDVFSIGAILFYMLSKNDLPINKANIISEIEKLQYSDELKDILKKSLALNLNDRYKNVHELTRAINQEYIKLYSKSKVFYLKYTNKIAADIYEYGKIKYRSNTNVENFIKNDLSKSSIYKGNRHYFVIGDTVKYQCHLSTDKSHLIINRVFIMESFMKYEEEYHKGIDNQISWRIVDQYKEIPYNTDLFNVLEKVNIEKQKRDVRLLRDSKNNLLVSKWEKYLDEENNLNNQKSNLGIYHGFEYIFETNKIKVQVNKFDYTLESGDLVQLTEEKGNQLTVGTFDSIEDDHIIISVKSDIEIDKIAKRGKFGIDVIQSAAAIKRFRRAVRALRFGELLNKNIKEIIVEPSNATIHTEKHIAGYIQENIDDSNKSAVKKALATKDLFLIQGPPGTGKTTVITEIVGQILKENPNQKILLSSPSHVAVDHAIQSIAEILDKDKKIIRVGRSERISKESQSLLINNQLEEWVGSVKNESKQQLLNYLNSKYNIAQELSDEVNKEIEKVSIEEVKDENNPLYQAPNDIKRIVSVIKEWHRRLNTLEEFDEIFAGNASVVAATCTGIASRHVLNNIAFDWVIIDEAARATAPELLLPMIRGKKVILVGNHQQLPPIVGNQRNKIQRSELGIKTSDLEKSLFEELFERISEQARSVLTAQFRMHPTISKLINDVFYPTTEIQAKKTAEERRHLLHWSPKSIIWLNTQYVKDNKEQEVLNSFRNSAEARIILEILERIEKNYLGTGSKVKVGIISGYDAQKKLLVNLIKPQDDKWKNTHILIDNVDAFQGSETDISIYNIVRCNDKSKIGFLRDERRLNVALSRGKTCLLIVGNADFASKAKTYHDNPFANIIRFIDKHPMECVMEDIK